MAREDDERLQPVAHRIAAGHQRGPRGRADRLAIEGFEPDAALRERIDVRRLDQPAAIAEIGIAEVVGHDEDDVGPERIGGGERRRREEAEHGSWRQR